MNALAKHVGRGDGVIDIGANIGSHVEGYALAVGPAGYVLAIEPDPDTADALRHRMADRAHVHVLTAAVSCMAQTARTLYRDRDRKRNSLYAENVLEPDEHTPRVEVPTVTLDEVAATVPRLRGIKIDAQGSEQDILSAAAVTLTNRSITWQVEIWPEGLRGPWSSAERLIGIFDAAGWRPVADGWPAIRARLATLSGHGAMDVLLQHRDKPW